ncbi:hypothetical protein FDG2_1909 [Candidatus Protofrankia californiensis]|uniref:DUF4209 domain-containing protein n=1 Tax=Candidatus Protofrankia californiensis TaxID=1839754 RepID=A0A1C3NWN5_9ACTN|nr:hypothetical protein FDG2_1909 [Candidatus Protofrankia californiensis]
MRAWTLSRRVGLVQLETEAVEAMKTMALEEVSDPEGGKAGVVLPLLTALAQPPRGPSQASARDASVEGLLDTALARYSSQAFLVSQITYLIRLYAIDDQRKELANRAEVQARLDAADGSSSQMVRMSFLTEAAALARRLGVSDLEAHAVSAMQAIRPEEMEWIRHPFPIELPTGRIEGRLRAFDGQPDWRPAIFLWLDTEPPTGRYSENERAARDTMSVSILQQMMPTVVFGGHGLPQNTVPASDAEQLNREIVQMETIHATIEGGLLASALERISKVFGIPSQDDLEIFLLEEYRCDPWLGRALATAFRLFWMGELDAAAHLAVPKIEAAVRNLLLLINEPLYRVEEGNKPGQFPALDFLLKTLTKEGLDHDWERFLGTFLLSRGNNYRNMLAHGFIHKVSRADAALALRALGMLTLITPNTASEHDAETVRRTLVQPIPRRPRSHPRRLADAFRAALWEYQRPSR